MKGFVFSFTPGRERSKKPRSIRKFTDITQIVRRYGSVMLFTLMFAAGMLLGSITAGDAAPQLLNDLDFLFTTNLNSRLSQPMFATFAASFASNFIFLLFVFLCGLAPWGMVAMPFAPAFKGFGTGLSAGYLFITYGFKGVGFYLLVILGGTFLFCFALIIQCVQAHYLSCKLSRNIFAGSDSVQPISVFVRSYLLRSLYMLLLTAAAALVDMMLWKAFSHLFF